MPFFKKFKFYLYSRESFLKVEISALEEVRVAEPQNLPNFLRLLLKNQRNLALAGAPAGGGEISPSETEKNCCRKW